MKTEEQIKKFRGEMLERFVEAPVDSVPFLQGVVYGLDWLFKEEVKFDS